MASKMFTLQTSSSGFKDAVAAAEGLAVGGPVGPVEGGPVGPVVGLSEGRAVGGPVMQTVGEAVGCVSGAVVGGRGSGLGPEPKKETPDETPVFLHTSVPMKYLLPKDYQFSPLALTLLSLDVGACLPPITRRPRPFLNSPCIQAIFSQSLS